MDTTSRKLFIHLLNQSKMGQIEDLNHELSKLSIINHEDGDLIDTFSNDNLLFKRILKIIFLYKLLNHFDSELKKSDSIDWYFPRRWRVEKVLEFEQTTKLETPKMTLSRSRANVLVLSFVIPILSFLMIFYYKIEYLIIPISILGLGVYIFLATLPAIAIGLISPKFFNPLDWPQIKYVDDFLDYLVVRNWDEYRKDSFSKTLIELKEVKFPFPAGTS